MKDFLAPSLLVHFPILALSVIVTFLFFGWKFPLLLWTTLSYPFVLLIASFLAKHLHPAFLWIPWINGGIILGFLLYILAYFFFPHQESPEVQYMHQHNREVFERAPRDFACDDGTFFTFQPVAGENNSDYRLTVFYYDQESLRDPENSFMQRIGWITRNNTSSWKFYGLRETDEQLFTKLRTCRNGQGKSLLDLYPEQATPGN